MTKKVSDSLLRRKLMHQEINKKSSVFFDLPKGLLALTIIMISAQVLLSNIFGVKGAELVKLDEEKSALLHEKTVIENQISELSALTRIEKDCQTNLSMKKIDKNVVYLSDQTIASLK